ncbi:MAG: AmmeMemoRadiSam system protein B, partial [Candidatus Altiarchaeota archaeon]
MIRPPAVAGAFYPGDPLQLQRQLQELIPKVGEKRVCRALICPHAGYVYSGGVAGKVYTHALPADTYIILGPNHTGYGPDFSIMHEGIWRTPLGDAKIDGDLAKEIYSQTSLIEADLLAHRSEHSIEVQLPFIQY